MPKQYSPCHEMRLEYICRSPPTRSRSHLGHSTWGSILSAPPTHGRGHECSCGYCQKVAGWIEDLNPDTVAELLTQGKPKDRSQGRSQMSRRARTAETPRGCTLEERTLTLPLGEASSPLPLPGSERFSSDPCNVADCDTLCRRSIGSLVPYPLCNQSDMAPTKSEHPVGAWDQEEHGIRKSMVDILSLTS